MTCEELKPDYLLYAIGTMGEPESSEIRAHLDRGCPVCTQSLREAQALAFSMGAVLEGPEPARSLRGRVLGIAGAVDRPRETHRLIRFWARPVPRWHGWALAVGGVLLAFAPGLLWYRELSGFRKKEAASAALLAAVQRSPASLRTPAGGAMPIYALEVERGRAPGDSAKQLTIARSAAAIVLALPEDLVHQASSAELRDASGRTVWTAPALTAAEADSTGLTIPVQVLSPGRYTVVMLAGNLTVALLPFDVTWR